MPLKSALRLFHLTSSWNTGMREQPGLEQGQPPVLTVGLHSLLDGHFAPGILLTLSSPGCSGRVCWGTEISSGVQGSCPHPIKGILKMSPSVFCIPDKRNTHIPLLLTRLWCAGDI